jgi:hypothetical protein
MGVFAILLKNKTLVMIIILCVILAAQTAYIAVLKSQKTVLVTQKESLKTLLDVSQSNVAQLTEDIKYQNAEVDKLKLAGETRLKLHEAEVKTAETTAAAHKKAAADLLKSTSPQNMSKCDAANLLINQELHNARK